MEMLPTSVPQPQSPNKLGMVKSPLSLAQTSQTLSDQLYPHYVANMPVPEWQAAPPAQTFLPGSLTDSSTPRPLAEGRLNFTRFRQDVDHADHLQRDRVNDSQRQEIEANATEGPGQSTVPKTAVEQVSAEDHHKRLQEEMRTLRQQQDQPDLGQFRADEALYSEKQRANELQQVEQAQALEQKRCAEEKVWREERQRKLDEVRDERAAAVSSAPVPMEEDVTRGRDAVLQAVLADLHRARDKLQTSEAKVAASEAEVAALRDELGGAGDAVGRAHAKAMELEALRTELREARSTAQHQGDIVRMRDVEITSLRKDLREARTAQLQCSPPRNIEADERCKLLEVQVDRLQAELLLKDSKLQEALSTASRAQQAEEQCKTLQSQTQLLQSDLSAKSAMLQEALQSRAAEGTVATHPAEERCKILEPQVQELQANLAKMTARCTELESNAERPRTRRGSAEDSGSHGTDQRPNAAEVVVDVVASSSSCLASAVQRPATPNSGNRSARFRQDVRQASALTNAAPADRYEELRQQRQEARQASTLSNAAPADFNEELRQQRQEVQQISTSANAAPSDRYEELMKLRKLLISGDADA
mmetsp:Transcript_126124/g.251882  ORF Transcript_126124/g.251882 Transcript_126124/m.251882 type:complete len:592 (+) Transcript_126124:57-1832(+)|eukprot:CAMPEP_0172662500 /NCGR_PEP_ID=MMETSP1074-20121228/5398_1 /TAXON_ID=2916 /ORGANISM="Ceratium fusus, Strain PA161109" /LENGTH=591 /DNA_ID=CAMNT_0013478423 /DNA_START=56 /DNA_END=1831 /DNA_ORIENTATION=+